MQGGRQFLRQRHLLALVVVLQQVAQGMCGIEQRKHRFAACARTTGRARSQRTHPRGVFIGQQFDAFVFQQIHPRRPARVCRHMGQQLAVFDGDVPRQRTAPALQVLQRAGEIRRHHIQQMRVQQGIHAAVLMLEISG